MQNYRKLSIFNFEFLILNSRRGGFTLLEVIVSIAILSIAVTAIIQLFSYNLNAITISKDYVNAYLIAEAKMREILDYEELSETSFSEITDDGHRIDVSVNDTLTERTENLQVSLLEIDLTVHWKRGIKDKSLTLRTMKVIEKQI